MYHKYATVNSVNKYYWTNFS